MKTPIGKLGSYSLHRNGPRRRRRRDSRFLYAEFWPNEPKQPPRIPSNPRERKLSARSGRTNPSGRKLHAAILANEPGGSKYARDFSQTNPAGANCAPDLGGTNPRRALSTRSWPNGPECGRGAAVLAERTQANGQDLSLFGRTNPGKCELSARSKRTRGIAPGEVAFVLFEL